jgi:hypothetical protein
VSPSFFLLPVAASLWLLDVAEAMLATLTAAAIHAWRSHGVRQRSSRVDILFLLVVAYLHRVRHRSSHVAVASIRLLGAAAPKQ